MWFDSWSDVLRILLVGTASYVALVVVLRVTGRRTLSQLNAFDFIVTVALGSVLASILLSSDVSWTEGVVALALLVALQYLVAVVSSRFPWSRVAITSRPVLLLLEGRLLPDALRSSRLTASEVRQAVRGSGVGDLRDVHAVILETNGKLHVIQRASVGDGSAIEGVEGYPGRGTQ